MIPNTHSYLRLWVFFNLNRSGEEKAPGLLNSNANHLLTTKVRQSARPGANNLCRTLAFLLFK